ncbi:MAG TPA: hypothetical protein PLB32_13850 [Acidobacteriota bacterium]|nr:hypothetical protein [Acidobacteriota bacterium]
MKSKMIWFIEFLLLVVPLSPSFPLIAQEDRDIRRKFATFDQLRPGPKKQPSKKKALPRNTTIGITLWKLRPPQPGEAANLAGLVSERIPFSTLVEPQDRLRLTIEAPQTGYVYLFTQEQYRDGSRGVPYLLFPSSRIRQGAHFLQAGKLIGLPGLGDRPPYFELEQSRVDHVAEFITVMCLPKPVPELTPTREPFPVSTDFLKKLASQIQGNQIQFQSDTGGKYTPLEAAAEQGTSSRGLKLGDPLPTSLFEVDRADGICISFQLKFNPQSSGPGTQPSPASSRR